MIRFGWLVVVSVAVRRDGCCLWLSLDDVISAALAAVVAAETAAAALFCNRVRDELSVFGAGRYQCSFR